MLRCMVEISKLTGFGKRGLANKCKRHKWNWRLTDLHCHAKPSRRKISHLKQDRCLSRWISNVFVSSRPVIQGVKAKGCENLSRVLSTWIDHSLKMGCSASRAGDARATTASKNVFPQAKVSNRMPSLNESPELISIDPYSGINSNTKKNTDLEVKNSTSITIIHFNDVYSIEPREQEPVGGASRFVTKVKQLSFQNPLILFSGDCLNPSLSKWNSCLLSIKHYIR